VTPRCMSCCPCGGSSCYKAVQVTPGCVVCVVLSGSLNDANVYCVVRVLVPVLCKAVQVTPRCMSCCPCGGSSCYKAVQVTPRCMSCCPCGGSSWLQGSASDANVSCVVCVVVPVVKSSPSDAVMIRQSK